MFSSSSGASFTLEDMGSESKKTRVAIIGAGAAGLAALRHVTTDLDKFEPIAYEKRSSVGGLWVYTDNTELDEHGLCNTMYQNLRTNLPKEVMAYPDVDYDARLASFIRHSDVRQYCEAYAARWGLHRFVKFQYIVLDVKPRASTEPTVWEVTVKDLATNTRYVALYDAIIICSGSLSTPYEPEVPGLNLFLGQVIHSRQYRSPEVYRGQKVICIGGSFSGRDIACDLAQHAEKVYISHKKYFKDLEYPKNVHQTPEVCSIGADHVMLQDGGRLEVDAIILCTGYVYNYPFLSPECGLTFTNTRVSPLYKHIFNINFPSMSFINLPTRVLSFNLSYTQAEVVFKVLSGTSTLPDPVAMLADEDACAAEIAPELSVHDLRSSEFKYVAGLSESYGTPAIPEGVKQVYQHAVRFFFTDINYKHKNFILSPDKSTYRFEQNDSESP